MKDIKYFMNCIFLSATHAMDENDVTALVWSILRPGHEPVLFIQLFLAIVLAITMQSFFQKMSFKGQSSMQGNKFLYPNCIQVSFVVEYRITLTHMTKKSIFRSMVNKQSTSAAMQHQSHYSLCNHPFSKRTIVPSLKSCC